MTSNDFMRLALAEAAMALRAGCHPYPGVGAVLVHQTHPIVRAHNGAPGGDHAEVKAIKEALAKGLPLEEMVLYTNLEPCSNRVGLVHACTREIIQVGLKEVHIAMRDPYHLVRGQGLTELREAGIHVDFGEMEEEARWLNKKYMERFCPSCGYPIVEV